MAVAAVGAGEEEVEGEDMAVEEEAGEVATETEEDTGTEVATETLVGRGGETGETTGTEETEAGTEEDQETFPEEDPTGETFEFPQPPLPFPLDVRDAVGQALGY